MAKYTVMVETLGANPTHSRGDIIEDSGDQKSLYDIPYLLRTGAIEKMGTGASSDREAPASATTAPATAPTGLDMVTPPGETGLSGVDLEDDQRAALADAGIRTADDVRRASDEQLRSVKGIGPATLTKLREATKV